jgi:DNA-binding transcriptional LysR family regulator
MAVIPVEMHQIRYFLAVSETLNFTRAAEKCHVSQPSLTRAIKLLEDELGGPLFHRERANTHLTDLGQLMLPHLQQVLAEADAAKQRAQGFVKLDDAPLKLGVMCTIGPMRLVNLMSSFQRRHPGVQVTMTDAGAKELQDNLVQGELDVAIYGMPGPIDERCHTRPLYDERFMIAFRSGHKFEEQNWVACKDLHDQPYLSRAKCEFAQHMRGILDGLGVVVKRPYRTEREDWVQGMILAGLGFGFIPEHSITLPGVHARPLIDPPITRTVHLVTVRGRPYTPAVNAFVRETTSFDWKGAA